MLGTAVVTFTMKPSRNHPATVDTKGSNDTIPAICSPMNASLRAMITDIAY
jgi:hypothetical protein